MSERAQVDMRVPQARCLFDIVRLLVLTFNMHFQYGGRGGAAV